jgi:hypothetical protein
VHVEQKSSVEVVEKQVEKKTTMIVRGPERTVTKWLPGGVVELVAERGPVIERRENVLDVSALIAKHEELVKRESSAPRWLILGGYGLGTEGPAYSGTVAVRAIGPVWVGATALGSRDSLAATLNLGVSF